MNKIKHKNQKYNSEKREMESKHSRQIGEFKITLGLIKIKELRK